MNDKVKSLFFSQYLGREIEYTPNVGMIGQTFYGKLNTVYLSTDTIFLDNGDDSNNYSLLLRDISHLTDEEIDLISEVYVGVDEFKKLSKSAKKNYRNEIRPALANCLENGLMRNSIWDTLKSFGILLPFTYLSETNQPITLTPAEIINLGWAKLQSNEQ